MVLDGVDLDVRRGETLVILGGSGSGKSTLLRCLLGLERPDEGCIRIWGTDMHTCDALSLMALRRRMGVAFQGGALFGSMTVADNVELPLLEFTDLDRERRRIIARIKLGMVDLEDTMDLYPSELSGGMRKRAALARALALDPEVLFFDEPSAGLDPISAAGLDRLLKQLRKTFEVTMVIVTHEMISAFTIADRVALMHEGRFVIVDTPSAVQQSDDRIVRRFLNRCPPESVNSAAKFQQFLEGLSLEGRR